MAITAKAVADLRAVTGAGMMDCKRALEQADGNAEAAVKWLREKGIASAAKREGRAASEGYVAIYQHLGGKIGVMVEMNCETDFVARNEEFQALAKELALQVAFSNPQWLKAEDIPEAVLAQEREIAANQARNDNKPEAAIPRIVEGRVKKFVEENCLLTQPYVRDNSRQVGDLVQDLRAKLGEHLIVRRFVRFKVGQEA